MPSWSINPKPSTPNPGMGLRHNGVWGLGFRVLVEGFNLSCHNQETILFTIDPYYGNLNLNPRTRTQSLHVDAPSQCAGTTNLAPKTWFLSSPFIIRVPFVLLLGFSKGALK